MDMRIAVIVNHHCQLLHVVQGPSSAACPAILEDRVTYSGAFIADMQRASGIADQCSNLFFAFSTAQTLRVCVRVARSALGLHINSDAPESRIQNLV